MKLPSGANMGQPREPCGAGGTICSALEVAAWRTHKLCCPASRTTYATYRPSGEIAVAATFPFVVRREIRAVVTSGSRSRSFLAKKCFHVKKAAAAIIPTTRTIARERGHLEDRRSAGEATTAALPELLSLRSRLRSACNSPTD